MYEYAKGNARAVPEWLNLELEQSLLEESITDAKTVIISAFKSMIIDKVRILLGAKALQIRKKAIGIMTHSIINLPNLNGRTHMHTRDSNP